MAELSFWYGFDVGALPEDRQLGLMANLERVKAQDRIHKQMYDPADYRGVRELYMDAYGDPALAQQAQTAALKQHMRNEVKE